jgi:hypothetical protein
MLLGAAGLKGLFWWKPDGTFIDDWDGQVSESIIAYGAASPVSLIREGVRQYISQPFADIMSMLFSQEALSSSMTFGGYNDLMIKGIVWIFSMSVVGMLHSRATFFGYWFEYDELYKTALLRFRPLAPKAKIPKIYDRVYFQFLIPDNLADEAGIYYKKDAAVSGIILASALHNVVNVLPKVRPPLVHPNTGDDPDDPVSFPDYEPPSQTAKLIKEAVTTIGTSFKKDYRTAYEQKEESEVIKRQKAQMYEMYAKEENELKNDPSLSPAHDTWPYDDLVEDMVKSPDQSVAGLTKVLKKQFLGAKYISLAIDTYLRERKIRTGEKNRMASTSTRLPMLETGSFYMTPVPTLRTETGAPAESGEEHDDDGDTLSVVSELTEWEGEIALPEFHTMVVQLNEWFEFFKYPVGYSPSRYETPLETQGMILADRLRESLDAQYHEELPRGEVPALPSNPPPSPPAEKTEETPMSRSQWTPKQALPRDAAAIAATERAWKLSAKATSKKLKNTRDW